MNKVQYQEKVMPTTYKPQFVDENDLKQLLESLFNFNNIKVKFNNIISIYIAWEDNTRPVLVWNLAGSIEIIFPETEIMPDEIETFHYNDHSTSFYHRIIKTYNNRAVLDQKNCYDTAGTEPRCAVSLYIWRMFLYADILNTASNNAFSWYKENTDGVETGSYSPSSTQINTWAKSRGMQWGLYLEKNWSSDTSFFFDEGPATISGCTYQPRFWFGDKILIFKMNSNADCIKFKSNSVTNEFVYMTDPNKQIVIAQSGEHRVETIGSTDYNGWQLGIKEVNLGIVKENCFLYTGNINSQQYSYFSLLKGMGLNDLSTTEKTASLTAPTQISDTGETVTSSYKRYMFPTYCIQNKCITKQCSTRANNTTQTLQHKENISTEEYNKFGLNSSNDIMLWINDCINTLNTKTPVQSNPLLSYDTQQKMIYYYYYNDNGTYTKAQIYTPDIENTYYVVFIFDRPGFDTDKWYDENNNLQNMQKILFGKHNGGVDMEQNRILYPDAHTRGGDNSYIYAGFDTMTYCMCQNTHYKVHQTLDYTNTLKYKVYKRAKDNDIDQEIDPSNLPPNLKTYIESFIYQPNDTIETDTWGPITFQKLYTYTNVGGVGYHFLLNDYTAEWDFDEKQRFPNKNEFDEESHSTTVFKDYNARSFSRDAQSRPCDHTYWTFTVNRKNFPRLLHNQLTTPVSAENFHYIDTDTNISGVDIDFDIAAGGFFTNWGSEPIHEMKLMPSSGCSYPVYGYHRDNPTDLYGWDCICAQFHVILQADDRFYALWTNTGKYNNETWSEQVSHENRTTIGLKAAPSTWGGMIYQPWQIPTAYLNIKHPYDDYYNTIYNRYDQLAFIGDLIVSDPHTTNNFMPTTICQRSFEVFWAFGSGLNKYYGRPTSSCLIYWREDLEAVSKPEQPEKREL